jgi:N-acetylglucosaminyl-diphospho-decaprenol L-rhamnosyltransferase
MRDIVISIINYRTAEMTIECARSVLQQIDGDIDAEIVIVDNRSDDGSIETLSDWIAGLPAPAPVRLVLSETNSGFSGGHNQGIAAVSARHYLLLNSDALLRPGFLQRILEAARANPDAGFIAPRLEYENGVVQISCFRFPGPISEFIRGANSGPVTRLFAERDVPLGPDPDPDEIEWASFACILVNGAMVDQIGPMDEGYFLYFEDAEYCLRARRAGWRLHRCPDAAAVHFRGGSAPVKALARERKRLPRYYYSSRTRFLYQAHGYAGLWAANLLLLVGRGIAGLRQLAGRRSGNFRQNEIRDVWTNIRAPLGPRFDPGE